jgi:hypothetical protein
LHEAAHAMRVIQLTVGATALREFFDGATRRFD